MFLLKTIIDFLIVLLLIRFLIRPIEINYNSIYNMIFKITDPLLKPAKTVIRNNGKATFITVLGMTVIRGFFYMTLGIHLISGIGVSLLELLQLLFQFYIAVWFIAILTGDSVQTPVISMLQRAFLPLGKLASKLNISRKSFSAFTFITLLAGYVVLSLFCHMLFKQSIDINPAGNLIEGLKLIVGLFSGFFTIVIIVSALLSWVSPDPYNPVVQTIYGISEPLLMPFRKIIPNLGGLDVSPIAAILCFQFIGGALLELLTALGNKI